MGITKHIAGQLDVQLTLHELTQHDVWKRILDCEHGYGQSNIQELLMPTGRLVKCDCNLNYGGVITF